MHLVGSRLEMSDYQNKQKKVNSIVFPVVTSFGLA